MASENTGGAGVMYWTDFSVEKIVPLTKNVTYDLEIEATYDPNQSGTTYQGSSVTYTVTKVG